MRTPCQRLRLAATQPACRGSGPRESAPPRAWSGRLGWAPRALTGLPRQAALLLQQRARQAAGSAAQSLLRVRTPRRPSAHLGFEKQGLCLVYGQMHKL